MTTETTNPTLLKQNYHSRKSNQNYMSVSLFKNFVECEAKTIAKLKGEYVESTTNALLVGSYVHAAFEDEEAFNQVVEENSDAIFKKRGGKYADFEQADRMIETLKNDKFAMFALEGEKEQILTADLFGVPWKIKVDSINHDRKTFSDIKTTQDLYKRYWSVKYDGWVSFIEKWDYVLQMAIYRKVIAENVGEMYTPYIVAVTKENPPNKAIVHFDESRFDFEYEWAEMKLNRILQVRNEEVESERCNKCDYCRRTKQLNGTIEVGALLYE
ncbi:PD-(D/E)XK nuclease-like domain-containing protein [Terrihalobacillus insolitus]|uniref:PD-(D/E)XK nuclease-like domain-containing protein n=1 Tax=Terrihalobacillus insolitus TaxID=2950438 RepID=UPI0023409F98|nr:PD-(D/E)XK nuclease-like domain-containing protein [Terrihalobacillus insolitus]MDC3414296.1 PD-(D/E)XK nuclease-like domain-containing protein [Terrihalobacillus insolitus]